MNINEISLDKNVSVNEAIQKLHKYGAICLPVYLDKDRIFSLNEEFLKILNDINNVIDHVNCINGTQIRALRERIDAITEYPYLSTLLSDSFINHVVLDYMSSFGCFIPEKLKLWEQLEIEHNYSKGRSNNSNWHYDRVPSLKASIYLHDTDESSGAFSVVPGSHNATRLLAKSELNKDPNPLNLNNFIRDDTRIPSLTMSAPAGTVTIFDTFIIHKGGEIVENQERRNIRLITFARPLTDHYLETKNNFSERKLSFLETYFSSDNERDQFLPEQYQYKGSVSLIGNLKNILKNIITK